MESGRGELFREGGSPSISPGGGIDPAEAEATGVGVALAMKSGEGAD